MISLWPSLAGALGSLTAKWSVFTAVGGFVLYVLGYLALRFHLTALGVGTDLAVLDERYLFEGAKFLIYFVSAVPVGLLVALPLGAIVWLVGRAAPGAGNLLGRWWASPRRPLTAGIVFAVLMIQLVMRQCFLFDNLLLRKKLPEPGWFRAILIADSDAPAVGFFTALLAGIAVTAVLASALGPWESAPPSHRMLGGLLLFLLGVQFLLLPVNYGYVITGRGMPRVVGSFEGAPPLERGRTAWMIWEGKEGVTYLIREADDGRKLMTVPRAAVKRVEIVAYDPLLRVLHTAAPAAASIR